MPEMQNQGIGVVQLLDLSTTAKKNSLIGIYLRKNLGLPKTSAFNFLISQSCLLRLPQDT
jgi:hypothetical protein